MIHRYDYFQAVCDLILFFKPQEYPARFDAWCGRRPCGWKPSSIFDM